ncbi:hypothetical protein B0H19DRAFT_689802 [Mycena capillaripes]|nr:hypothetical protein B0H19DRAFT_689802 [Mycena capillaripes]
MRTFAQELVDDVIDHCDVEIGGTAVMKTCGLVCKRWLPRSRLHLFTRVILDADNLLPFIDIINSSSSPILSSIRHLTLRFAGRSLDDALLEKIHQCPNLERLEVSTSEIKPEMGEFFQSLQINLPSWASNAPSFSRFDFECVDSHLMGLEPGRIFDIIRFIPALKFLRLSGVSVFMLEDLRPRAHSLPLQWQTLHLDSLHSPGTFLLSLLRLPTIPALKSLKFRLNLLDKIGDLEVFFQHAGHEIELFSLDIPVNELRLGDEPDMVGRLVRHTPKLKNLELGIPNPSVIPEILSLLPPYAWDAIIFVFYHRSRKIAWGDVDIALAGHQFRTLRQFDLQWFTKSGETVSMITPAARSVMPLAYARGILASVQE